MQKALDTVLSFPVISTMSNFEHKKTEICIIHTAASIFSASP